MRSLAVATVVALMSSSAVAQTLSPTNPFAQPSTLPYQAPPFDRIQVSDYQPAIEEGMKRQLAEVAAIADNPERPTFANTIEAMERSVSRFCLAVQWHPENFWRTGEFRPLFEQFLAAARGST